MEVQVLGRPIYDHSPSVVKIGTTIPKANVFRLENYWIYFPGFLDVVSLHWNIAPYCANAATTLNAKFKQVRLGLRKWSKEFSRLGRLIHNCNYVMALLDGLEEQRLLAVIERSFRRLVKQHLAKLLEAKKEYIGNKETLQDVLSLEMKIHLIGEISLALSSNQMELASLIMSKRLVFFGRHSRKD